MLGPQRLPEQRVVHQINLADGTIVCCSPISIKATCLFPFEGVHTFASDGFFLHGDARCARSAWWITSLALHRSEQRPAVARLRPEFAPNPSLPRKRGRKRWARRPRGTFQTL